MIKENHSKEAFDTYYKYIALFTELERKDIGPVGCYVVGDPCQATRVVNSGSVILRFYYNHGGPKGFHT